MDKRSVRADLLQKLSLLSDENILSLSFALTNQLIKLFHYLPELESQVGAGFLPLRAEIAPMYQELFRKIPLSVAFPILKNGEMAFGLPQGLARGAPWLEHPYHEVQPDWVLVPGVGFDLTGARLGRGKGFYDRYLSEHEGPRIGLCWSEQIVENIPVESHDCHMDFIITESFCWDVDQQKKF